MPSTVSSFHQNKRRLLFLIKTSEDGAKKTATDIAYVLHATTTKHCTLKTLQGMFLGSYALSTAPISE